MNTRTSRWIRGVLGLGLLLSLSCANATIHDFKGKRTALDESQRRYTELVRWGEIEMASVFVDPELLDEYLQYAEVFEGIRFTDFESGALQFEEGEDKASVIVVYHAYSLSTLIEKKIREHQEWYREDGMSNNWRVRPNLRQIVAGVTGAL